MQWVLAQADEEWARDEAAQERYESHRDAEALARTLDDILALKIANPLDVA